MTPPRSRDEMLANVGSFYAGFAVGVSIGLALLLVAASYYCGQ